MKNYTPENIKKELSKFKISDFTNLTHRDLILKLLNIQSKLIAIQKYKVFISDEVKIKLIGLDENTKKSYEDIIKILSKGNDINPYLSKRCIEADFYDKLFLDWEIKHLHINSKVALGYFNERADFLLIATVQENFIYFLDIIKHEKENVFVDIEYLKIIKRNWEELLEPYKIPDRCCEEIDNPTNEEIRELRNSNINVPICLDEEVYFNFNNGLSGAGTNSEHVSLANEIIKEYKK